MVIHIFESNASFQSKLEMIWETHNEINLVAPTEIGNIT